VVRSNAVLKRDVDVFGHVSNILSHRAGHLRLTTNVSALYSATVKHTCVCATMGELLSDWVGKLALKAYPDKLNRILDF